MNFKKQTSAAIKIFIILLFTVPNFACAKKIDEVKASLEATPETSTSTDYENHLLDGTIDGQQWIMQSGKAKPSFADPSKLSLTFSDKVTSNPCNNFEFGQREVLTTIPKAVGETVLGQGSPMSTATFFISKNGSSQNLITTVGKINILEVTNQDITGQVSFYLNGNNVVNGIFKIPVCPGFAL